MKSVKKVLSQLLLVASLMLPWATTEALDSFEKFGTMSSISLEGSFIVNGKTYRVASDAKLISKSADRQKLSDFKKGDEVFFKGHILNGAYYVDLLIYNEPDES